MTVVNAVTDYTREGDIGIITLNSPPVNALSVAVRDGLAGGFAAAIADEDAKAIVLICDGRTFIAGADISELGGESAGTSMPVIQDAMEASPKPIVAAIHGTALGGGLEVALTCHYRVAVPSARCGLPEVSLGLLPGAGGTQRLPRIVGPEKSLEMMTSGQHLAAPACLAIGLVDELVEEGKLRDGAIAFAEKILAEKRPLKKVRDLNNKVVAARGHPEIFDDFRKANARKFRGFLAPEYNIRCIEAAVNLPFDEGIQFEQKLFLELLFGAQSAAQRYSFFGERQVAKIPDVPDDTPLIPINAVGVVGAGVMGGGIAMTFANAGLPVSLVDADQAALDHGLSTIRSNYERTAKRGGLTTEQVEQRMGLIKGGLDFAAVAQADLIVEAVFERLDVKQAVFAKLDAVAKPGAILATNTSYLDIDAIASATERPGSVIGTHFFSPANVMRLLEVVRGPRTSKEVVATAMKLGRKIGKLCVLAGNSEGFIGNRMLFKREREADRLLLEGVMPWDIDRALYDFGFPMGPFAMRDLAGLNVGWVKETSKGETIRDVLCEMGRFGQKTGGGYYDYDESRNPSPSPVAERVIRDFVAKAGVTPRTVSDEEIVERCLYPMVNEGAKILAEGVALRAVDIDMIWQNGYGWPAYRGGPMFWAGQVGLDKVLAGLKANQALYGADFTPAALLETLASEGKRFAGA